MPTKAKAAPVEEQEYQEEVEDYSEVELETEPETEPVKLVGQELLDFYAEKKEAGCTHADIAQKAGYYTVTKAGRERVMLARFNEAFLEAQGVETGGRSTGTGRSHAGLTRARVSGQGILLVSQLATRHVGAVAGAVFEVTYPGDGQILLSPTGEIKPVMARKSKATEEEPGTPLLDQAA